MIQKIRPKISCCKFVEIFCRRILCSMKWFLSTSWLEPWWIWWSPRGEFDVLFFNVALFKSELKLWQESKLSSVTFFQANVVYIDFHNTHHNLIGSFMETCDYFFYFKRQISSNFPHWWTFPSKFLEQIPKTSSFTITFLWINMTSKTAWNLSKVLFWVAKKTLNKFPFDKVIDYQFSWWKLHLLTRFYEVANMFVTQFG